MDDILEIEITTTIQIDIVDLAEQENLTLESSIIDIQNAVDDYIGCLDDTEFYVIGDKETEVIIKRVREYLNNMCGEN